MRYLKIPRTETWASNLFPNGFRTWASNVCPLVGRWMGDVIVLAWCGGVGNREGGPKHSTTAGPLFPTRWPSGLCLAGLDTVELGRPRSDFS